MNTDKHISAILLWVEGNTGVSYRIKDTKTNTFTENGKDWETIVVFTESEPIPKRSHFSMIVSELYLVISRTYEKIDETANTQYGYSVRFTFVMNDKSIQSQTINIDFLGEFLYRVW